MSAEIRTNHCSHHIYAVDSRGVYSSVNDETVHERRRRLAGEYAIARAEHKAASQALANLSLIGDRGELDSLESLAEQVARRRLLDLRDELTQLGADSGLEAPGGVED